MTDNEIIKDFEKLTKYSGFTKKVEKLLHDVIELINRQKAEIERLKKENEILSKNADTAFQDGLNEAQDLYALQIKNEIKSETVKEFAERLKTETFLAKAVESVEHVIWMNEIDNLVKEMTEVETNQRKEDEGK